MSDLSRSFYFSFKQTVEHLFLASGSPLELSSGDRALGCANFLWLNCLEIGRTLSSHWKPDSYSPVTGSRRQQLGLTPPPQPGSALDCEPWDPLHREAQDQNLFKVVMRVRPSTFRRQGVEEAVLHLPAGVWEEAPSWVSPTGSPTDSPTDSPPAALVSE